MSPLYVMLKLPIIKYRFHLRINAIGRLILTIENLSKRRMIWLGAKLSGLIMQRDGGS